MPFSRKKLKIVGQGTAGRKNTRWVTPRPKADPIDRRAAIASVQEASFERDSNDVVDYIDYEETIDGSESQQENGERRPKLTYALAKQRDYENWCGLRTLLLDVAQEMEGPPRIKSCLNCKMQFLNVKGVFRCSDCGPAYLVCGECIKADHHFRPNHLPEKWTVSSSTQSL